MTDVGGHAEPDRSDLVLASRSPRRLALLRGLGLHVVVDPADVDETPLAGEDPTSLVTRLAEAKASTVASTGPPVLAGDTVVADGGRVLGKPRDRVDAAATLGSIAGRTVAVHSAVSVVAPGEAARTATVVTRLVMASPGRDDITAYLATGEADDKAGGLAVQGAGRSLVERIEGCWSNVLGLPLCATLELLGVAGRTGRSCPGPDCSPGHWRHTSAAEGTASSVERSTTDRQVRQSSSSGFA